MFRQRYRFYLLRTTLKRRNTKKQIRRLELELLPLVMKYLHANQRMHHDVSATYENQIEWILYSLVECHLRLDRSWPRENSRFVCLDGSTRQPLAHLRIGGYPNKSDVMVLTSLSRGKLL